MAGWRTTNRLLVITFGLCGVLNLAGGDFVIGGVFACLAGAFAAMFGHELRELARTRQLLSIAFVIGAAFLACTTVGRK